MFEFKELELEIAGLSEEPEQARLHLMLKKMSGVHAARITRNGVHITYNPKRITPEEIAGVMKSAGFKIAYLQPS